MGNGTLHVIELSEICRSHRQVYVVTLGLCTATEQEKQACGYIYCAILYLQFKHERHTRICARVLSTIMICKLQSTRYAAWERTSALNFNLIRKIEHRAMLICTGCLECCTGLYLCCTCRISACLLFTLLLLLLLLSLPSDFILLNMHLMATRTPSLKRALNSLGLSVDVVKPGVSQQRQFHT